MAKNILHCSFCGRSRDEVKILIAGQEGHICENCVDHAREIIDQELQTRNENGAFLSCSDIIITNLQQARKYALHVFTHVAGLRKHCRIHDCKWNIQQFRDRLCE